MVRKLTAALLGVGVFVPGLANALGLGEIKLNSHLSEPLDAEIELVQTRELTESEILPGLASPDDFKTAGVERFHHLTDMKFEVVVNNNGRSYIKVKSRKPIREPFVNFLVEVHWPAGRLLREYTLLLDPPNFSLAAPQPVQPAVTTTAAPTKVTVNNQPVQQPAAVQAPVASQPAASAPQESGAGKTYGPTGSSDSLWSIARALRPASDVSIQQTMIAIQQLNPDAFINGNINLLKKGKILRGPSAEQAREYTTREAINLVNQQNRAWKDRISSGRSAAETETAQIDTSGRAVDSFEEAVRSDDGRLRLVSADEATDTGGSTGQGGAAEGSTGGVLRERAELAEETADQFRLQNDDLKSKVNELEEQVGTGEKLLDLKDDQIAALQARLAKLEAELEAARKEGVVPATSEAVATAEPEMVEPVVEAEPEVIAAVEPEATPEPVVPEESGESVDYNFQDEAQSEEAEAEAAPETAAVAEPEQAVQVEASPKQVVVEPPEQQVAQVPEKEPTFVEKVLGNPLYMAIIGGGIAALAVIGLILGRRRGEQSDELDDALVEDFSLDVDDEPSGFDEALDETEVDHQHEETVAETADVLGEADIYIAYGRFPQAIEMLEKAADAEPQRSDIRMKLLETSIEAQDQDTFMRHYQEVQELGDPDASARANALKSKFIDGGDAAGDEAPADFDAGDDTLVMSTDLGADETTDSSVDFDLPDDGDDTLMQPAVAESDAVEEADELGADLDFNLDFEAADSVEEAADVSLDDAADSLSESVEDAPAADLDFNLDVDAGLEDAASMDMAEETDEGLQFDSDFSLDLEEEEDAQAPEEVSFGEAEESLDFELAEESEAETGEASEESLEFNLDLDAVEDAETEALDAAPVDELDDDATLIAPTEEAQVPAGDVIGSMEAAKLADELDLDGDFNLDVDADLDAGEPVADDGEFTIEVEEDDPSAEEEIEVAPQDLDQPSAEDAAPEAELDVAVAAAPAMDIGVPPASAAANSEEELDFLSDADEASTKLDLARAYIDMGDREGAKDILDEVLIEGNDDQQGEAKELLARLD